MVHPARMGRLRVDRLAVEILPDRDRLGTVAGRAVAQHMRARLSQQSKVRMVFASAPSQNELLAELSRQPGLDWRRVEAFHMDEYVGLSGDAHQSFVRYLRDHLYDRVQPGLVQCLNGLAPDLEAECRRYADLVNEAPIDIVCCGIGENGHLAFNDPPNADFNDPKAVKVVDLALQSRKQQVRDGCFSELGAVPRQALTLTIPMFMAARQLYCIVPGKNKAKAVRDALLGPVSAECPAGILRHHESAVLYLDADSARLFQVGRCSDTSMSAGHA